MIVQEMLFRVGQPELTSSVKRVWITPLDWTQQHPTSAFNSGGTKSSSQNRSQILWMMATAQASKSEDMPSDMGT